MNNLLSGDLIKRGLEFVQHNIRNNSAELMVGSIISVSGLRLEATGLRVPLGTICEVEISPGTTITAEVIGLNINSVYLMSMQNIAGIKNGAPVIPLSFKNQIGVGGAMLGRVFDASGIPIDGLGLFKPEVFYPLKAEPINPLERPRITKVLDVGIRAINGMLTIGKGQRIGIFSSSGIGKSVLLGMMTRFTSADIVVVGLVGERGREVKEFIEESLGKEGLKRSVVVASPADTSPLMRANSALLATTIAEHYRNQGLDVLLIIDSITRFAFAEREISLAVGELPATKGFTPSVFAKLSTLIERSGNGKQGTGTITAFYTILVDGDNAEQDPIADHIKSILDGHIILSRQLADAGLYPAIDFEKSISRVMPAITSREHQDAAMRLKQIYSAYQNNKDMINMGMYHPGSDRLVDEAIAKIEKIRNFLSQRIDEPAKFEDAVLKMREVVSPTAMESEHSA